ncbi:MAG: hypothetical protein KF851_15620 [Pirellulaceae bacterium]|nr:hypothetical protein [Pirellulaceae bacterium]
MIPFLMDMLDAGTKIDEQLQPLVDQEFVHVALLREPFSSDEFHHLLGPAVGSRPSIQNPRC